MSAFPPRLRVLVAVAGLTLGCASARYLVRPDPKNADELYAQSVEDMEAGMFPEAVKGFSDLKTKYPYTKFAALADLRTADTNLHRAKYIEAVDGYRNFLKFHPNHEEAPYAMMQIGETYWEQLPEDWFFLPPAAEKDQGNTRLAISAFEDVIARYPKAKAADTARERLAAARARLADHELYVAEFYLGRDQYRAAAGRAEVLVKEYADIGYDEKGLWIAGYSRFHAGEFAQAASHLTALFTKYPQGSRTADAKALFAQIKLPAAPTPAAEPAPAVVPVVPQGESKQGS